MTADKGTRTLLRIQYTFDFQFTVRANDGVRVDGQVHGKLADRRQPVSRLELAAGNAELDLFYDLSVERHAALCVDR